MNGQPIQPARLRMRRAKGFNLQEASFWANGLPAVLVSRPSAFGNPFYIGGLHKICLPETSDCPRGWRMMTANPDIADDSFTAVRDAKTSVALYVNFLRVWGPPKGVERLKGKNLACYCRLCARHAIKGKRFSEPCADCAPCHADILGEIAQGRERKIGDL